MSSFTPEVEQFIMQRRLGLPMEIYAPDTIFSIIGGLFLMAIALFWTWMALPTASIPLLSSGLSAIGIPHHAFLPTFPSGSMPFIIFNIGFPLFGLVIFCFGLWVIYSAVYNRNMRAVICTYGVVLARPSGTDSFYWQDVLTTFRKIDIHVPNRYHNRPTLVIGPNGTVRHTYTVHCHDGRKFIFKSPLAHIQELSEDIEVQVARAKQAQVQPRMY